MAIHCARMGHTTKVWAMEQPVVDGINGEDHENTVFLKGYKCPPSMTATTDIVEVVSDSELLLMVIPTQFVARTMGE